MALIILLYALFASVFTLSKWGLLYASPFFLIGTRMVAAAILIFVYLFWKSSEPLPMKKGSLFRIFRLAFFMVYLTNICEFWGLQYLSSAKTCFLYSLSPFISALFSYFIFSEQLSLKQVLGLLIGFFGFFPILMAQSGMEEITGYFWVFSKAELALMVAVISSVYGWILLGQLVKLDGNSPLMVNAIGMFIGGIMALIHSFFVEEWNPFPVFEWIPFLECTIFLTVISNLICYNLYGYLLKRYSATLLSFCGFITPFFAAFFGWVFLGETVSWPFYLSAIIVFSGLLLFYQEELRILSRSKIGSE